jgi:CRP/FNR family transcriptional regulator, cyclic AMP receptor protein
VDLAHTDIPLPLADSTPHWLGRLRAIAGGSLRGLLAGHLLLREGDRPSCLWAIQSGAVSVSSTAPSGWRATVAILGRGDVLGDEGLIPHTRLPRDPLALPEARALIPTTVCSIGYPALRAAMASDPRVARWVAAAVGRRAAQVQRALARTLALRVGDRLLAVFQDLATRFGRDQPNGVLVPLPLTQDLLASMVGATRETVNRAIADLERDGRVRRVGLRYVLPDPGLGSGGSP